MRHGYLGWMVSVVLLLSACGKDKVVNACNRPCVEGERCATNTGLCVPLGPPLVSIDEPLPHALLAEASFRVAGLVTDDDRPYQSAQLSVDDGGTWLELGVDPAGAFDQVVTTPDVDGVSTDLLLRVVDAYGAEGRAELPVVFDRVAPHCRVVTPTAGAVVGGTSLDVELEVTDGSHAFAPASLSSDQGATWTEKPVVAGRARFTVALPQDLEGTLVLKLAGGDAAGNRCAQDLEVQVDTRGPSITEQAPMASGTINRPDAGSIEVRFTVYDGSTVTLAEVQAPPAPTWKPATLHGTSASFTWTLPAGDDGAPRVLRLRASDSLGNVTTHDVPVTVDVLPPVCTLNAPFTGEVLGADAGVVTLIRWTVFDGNPAPGMGEVSMDDGASWTQVALGAGGAAQFAWALPATDDGAAHTIRVRGTDGAGNTCPERSAQVSVDVVGPVLAITSPALGAVLGGATAQLKGTVSDGSGPVTQVTVDLADGAGPRRATLSAGGWSLTAPLPAAEDYVAHPVTVLARDAAGNTTQLAWRVIVDRVAPQLLVVTPAEGQALGLSSLTSGSVTLQTQVTDGDPGAVTEVLVGATWQPLPLGSGTVATSATDNGTAYTQVVRARDGAGNTTQASRSYTVDRVAPSLVGTVPVGGGVSGGRTFAAQFSEPIGVTGPSVPVSFVPAAPATTNWALDGSSTVMTVTSLAGDQAYSAQVQDARITDLAGNPLVATMAVNFRTRPARPSNGQVLIAQSATQKVEWFRSSVDADGTIALLVRVINPATSVRTWLLGWADPKTGNWTLQDSQPATETGASLVSYVEQVNGVPRRRASAWLGDGTTGVMYTWGTAGSVTGTRLFAPPLAPNQQPGADYGTFVNTGVMGWGFQRTNNPTLLTYSPPVALALQGTNWGVMAGDGSGNMIESHLDCVTFGSSCTTTTASGQVSQVLDCSSGTCLQPCNASYYHYVRTPSAWALLQPACGGSLPFVQMATDAQTTHYRAVTATGSAGVANADTANDEAWLAWTQSPSNTTVAIGSLTLQLGVLPNATKTITVEPLQPLTTLGVPDYQYVLEPVVGPSTVGLLYVTNGSLMFRE